MSTHKIKPAAGVGIFLAQNMYNLTKAHIYAPRVLEFVLMSLCSKDYLTSREIVEELTSVTSQISQSIEQGVDCMGDNRRLIFLATIVGQSIFSLCDHPGLVAKEYVSVISRKLQLDNNQATQLKTKVFSINPH